MKTTHRFSQINAKARHQVGGNLLRLLQSGPEYFNRITEAIADARQFIHIQVYIWELDGTGAEVLEACIAAAKRGVKVFILLDKYGSAAFHRQKIKTLEAAGLHIRLFSNYLNFRRFQLGRTLHTKVVVIDGERAWLGGINIADRYSGRDKSGNYADYALEIHGPAIIALQHQVNKYWRSKWRNQLNHSIKPLPDVGESAVSIGVNDFIRGKIEITAQYGRAIWNAKNELLILSSYFFPIIKLRRLLYEASERGVAITLILPGQSDMAIFKNATRSLYRKLLNKGMKISEWQGSMLHAKVAFADSEWFTIGSYNLNQLSDYGSVEVNAMVWSSEFIQSAKAKILQDVSEHTREVMEEEIKNRRILGQITDNLCLLMVRTLLRLIYLLNTR